MYIIYNVWVKFEIDIMKSVWFIVIIYRTDLHIFALKYAHTFYTL